MVSAKCASESVVEGLKSGANDFVAKPFDRVSEFGVWRRGLLRLGRVQQRLRAWRVCRESCWNGLPRSCNYGKEVRLRVRLRPRMALLPGADNTCLSRF